MYLKPQAARCTPKLHSWRTLLPLHAIVASVALWGLMASSILKDVEAVRQFLADKPKTLAGPAPEFGATTFHRNNVYEWDAKWPIADSLGVITSGQLRIVLRPGSGLGPSMSVIFNRQMVTRLDFDPPEICETNPLWAAEYALPPRVCGPHLHGWEPNERHVLETEDWELPCREALPPQIRRFEQAFPWLCDRINVLLTPEQRLFSLPGQLLV